MFDRFNIPEIGGGKQITVLGHTFKYKYKNNQLFINSQDLSKLLPLSEREMAMIVGLIQKKILDRDNHRLHLNEKQVTKTESIGANVFENISKTLQCMQDIAQGTLKHEKKPIINISLNENQQFTVTLSNHEEEILDYTAIEELKEELSLAGYGGVEIIPQ